MSTPDMVPVKRKPWRWSLLLALFGFAVLCSGLAVWFNQRTANRFHVINQSGQVLYDLQVEIQKYNGTPLVNVTLPTFAPGEARSWEEHAGDSKAHLQFRLQSQTHTFEEPYIDFWTGEGWTFKIQPDGSVQTGYDYDDTFSATE